MTTQLAFNQINGNVVSVKDYGAVLDDTTDDRLAWQAAFDYLETIGGGYILCPGKSYVNVASNTINGKANVGIIGHGWGISQLRSSGANRTIEWQDNECLNVVIRDMKFDVASGSDFDTIIAFDSFNDTIDNHNISVTNCYFTDSNIVDAKANNWTVAALQLRGIHGANIAHNMTYGCQIKAGGGGVVNEHINVTHNIIVEAQAYSISCVTTQDGTLRHVNVSDNICINPHRSCIFVGRDGDIHTGVTTENMKIMGNICVAGTNTVGSDNFLINVNHGQTNDGCIVANNVVDCRDAPNTTGPQNGIRIKANTPQNPQVYGNRIFGGGDQFQYHIQMSGVSNAHCSDNYCGGSTGRGIYISGSGTVKDNTLNGESTNALKIYCEDNCDKIDIIDNTFVGCLNLNSEFTNKPITLDADTGTTINAYIARNRIKGADTANGIDEFGSGTINAEYFDNDFSACTSAVFKRRVTAFTDCKRNKGITTENYGNATDTTDGSGNITVAHGCITTPTYLEVNMSGDNTYDAVVQSVDATNITIRVRNTTDNSDVTTTSVTVYWKALV